MEYAKRTLKPEGINNKLLLRTDNEGSTAWRLAALVGQNIEIIKIMAVC